MDYKQYIGKNVQINWKDAYLAPNTFHDADDVSELDDYQEVITAGTLLRVSRSSVFVSNEYSIQDKIKSYRGITVIPKVLILSLAINNT